MAGVQQYISSLYLWDLWVFFIFRDFAISIMAGAGLLGWHDGYSGLGWRGWPQGKADVLGWH
jgi:hypothetical protein